MRDSPEAMVAALAGAAAWLLVRTVLRLRERQERLPRGFGRAARDTYRRPR